MQWFCGLLVLFGVLGVLMLIGLMYQTYSAA